jgi:CoA-transferase family III
MDLHHRLFGTPIAADDDGRWAASGAMALTGSAAPLLPPRSLVPVLRSLESELAARTAELGTRVELDAAALLGERAAIAGLTRRGRTSCGGSTRLLPARDDWVAVALPRPDDVALVPAWLGTDDVVRGIKAGDAGELVEAAALLGIACGRLGETSAKCPAVRWARHRAGPPRGSVRDALVVDLSGLWAGPLCGHVLTSAGARVVKIESASRLDGARRGPPAFYDLLHAGQESAVLDLPAEADRLRAVVRAADVVIDASRPRAMTQLGIDVDEVAEGGTVWVSITGHGRDGEGAGRVAFGDDAAVAGGLVAEDDGGPAFVADAVADPLTGMVAAVAALDRFATGGGWVVDVSMARVAAWCAIAPPSAEMWSGPIASPRARRAVASAAPAGRETARFLREVGA